MNPRRRRRRRKSEDLLFDIDLKMTREAFKRAEKPELNYIT